MKSEIFRINAGWRMQESEKSPRALGRFEVYRKQQGKPGQAWASQHVNKAPRVMIRCFPCALDI
jgi:hypothetical protein